MSETWIKISLDSNYFVAGDRLTGEVVLRNGPENSLIMLKSQGTEKVSLTRPGEEEKSYTNPIFSLSEQLARTHDSQAVFPFTFSIPSFAPSSFHFQDVNQDQVRLTAEVIYSLEVHLIQNNQILQKDSQDLTIFNKSFRMINPSTSDFNSSLSSCWCVNRGISRIQIESLEKQQSSTKDIKKYNVSLISEENNRLVSVIAQVIFEINFSLPGEKPLHFRKIISRHVPNIENIKRNSKIMSRLEFLFEADLATAGMGENPSSNNSVLFQSHYNMQVFGIYDVGFRSKRAEGEVPLQVNPWTSQFQKLSLPKDWDPVEHHLKSLILSSSSSFHSMEEA
jgi:hypothetical protein